MIAFQEERFCKKRIWRCVYVFGDMGSKRNVFSEYEEWENEHKMTNDVIEYLAMLLGFSTGSG